MPRINPHLGLFAALAVLMVALFGWLRSDVNAMEARLETRFDTRLDASHNALVDRMAGLEAGQNALAERMARIETGQDKLVERVARIEGRIEGVLTFARGGSFADPAPPPRDPAPPR